MDQSKTMDFAETDYRCFITALRYAYFSLFQHPEQAIPMIPSRFQP